MSVLHEVMQMVTEPFVVCTYGPSGIGKTTDMGYSFPRALFLTAPGALNSISSVCGYMPRREEAKTLGQVISIIERESKSQTRLDTVVIDDFSFLCEQTFSELEQKMSGFKLWGKMRDLALEFRDRSRYAGINVVLNAWEGPPKTKDDGSRVRGGPQLSGKLPEQIPALCDVVLRAVHEPKRKPWGAVYRCNPDPGYVMKDRFDVAAIVDPAPMNLGEILRASGKILSRLESYPEQEDHVEQISEAITGDNKADAPVINDVYKSLIAKGRSVTEARWTLRDAMDRRVIKNALKARETCFLDMSPKI